MKALLEVQVLISDIQYCIYYLVMLITSILKY
jgi:hypothetical protein